MGGGYSVVITRVIDFVLREAVVVVRAVCHPVLSWWWWLAIHVWEVGIFISLRGKQAPGANPALTSPQREPKTQHLGYQISDNITHIDVPRTLCTK